MTNFTAEKTFNIPFDGDVVTCTLLAPSIEALAGLKGLSTGKESFKFDDSIESFGKMKILLAPLIKDINCLDTEGNALSLDVIFSHTYFLGLIISIMKHVLELGGLTVEQVKKLESMSDELLEDSA